MERPQHSPLLQRDPVAKPDLGLAPAEKELRAFEEALKNKASAAEASKRQPSISALWARVRSARRIVAALAICGVLGALLIGLVSYDVTPSMTATAVEQLSSVVDGALELIGVRAAEPVATEPVTTAPSKETRKVTRPAKVRAPLDSRPPFQLPLVSAETAHAIQPAPIHADGTPENGSEGDLSIIYSTNDIEVSPPVAIRSPGHVDSGKREDGASLIEIVVSETGAVESTKEQQRPVTVGAALQSTTALSVVKAWRFQPARKDGQPVKYRTTVRFVPTMSPAGMRDGTR